MYNTDLFSKCDQNRDGKLHFLCSMWAKNTWVKLHWWDNFTLLTETFKILFSMKVKLPSRSKNTNNKIDHSVWNKHNTTSKYIYSWFPTFSHWLVNIHEYCFASGRYMYLHRLYTGIYVLLHKFSLYKPLDTEYLDVFWKIYDHSIYILCPERRNLLIK